MYRYPSLDTPLHHVTSTLPFPLRRPLCLETMLHNLDKAGALTSLETPWAKTAVFSLGMHGSHLQEQTWGMARGDDQAVWMDFRVQRLHEYQ